MTRKVKGGLWETIVSLRWATGVKLGDSVVNVVECHQEKPAEETYYGSSLRISIKTPGDLNPVERPGWPRLACKRHLRALRASA